MKASIKNTLSSIFSLMISTLLGFLLRKSFITYLGAEILGVNATIIETVNLLSVMELGVESAIVYKMYAPINTGDEKRIRQLFVLYKNAYRIIGTVIVLLGLILLPFIGKIVNTTVSLDIVRLAFIIRLCSIGLSYYLGYYKLILNAHQQMHLYIPVNTLLNSLVSVLQIIIIYKTQNYIAYITLVYISILGMYFYTRFEVYKKYPYLNLKEKVDKNDILNLKNDIKQLLAGQISGYIYGSTDNILLSYFFGSISTGFVSNYKLVINTIRSVLGSIYIGVNASWGAFLNSDRDEKEIFDYYRKFNFIEYVACMVLLTPTTILIDKFIIIVFGPQFVIGNLLKILLIFDAYGTYISQPAGVFINNLGMFREEKIISSIAAILNISFSIIGALIIGKEGIFLATDIVVLFYWIFRGYAVDKKCFKDIEHSYLYYWKEQLLYFMSFLFVIYIGHFIDRIVVLDSTIVEFIVVGIMMELFNIAIIVGLYRKTDNYMFFKAYIQKIIGLKNNQ